MTGDFGNHDAVRICDAAGKEVGRGLSNYARNEVAKLMVRRILATYNASMLSDPP